MTCARARQARATQEGGAEVVHGYPVFRDELALLGGEVESPATGLREAMRRNEICSVAGFKPTLPDFPLRALPPNAQARPRQISPQMASIALYMSCPFPPKEKGGAGLERGEITPP